MNETNYMKKLREFVLTNYYLYRKDTSFFQPRLTYIEPTNNCVMKCYMCPSRIGHREKGFMTLDVYKKIIDDMHYYKKNFPLKIPSNQVIYLQGQGEPLISGEIFDMIKYAKNKNFKVGLDTTGALLYKEKINELIKSNIDVISFSFYGWSRESYKKIHGSDLFKTSFHNIINLLHSIKGTDINPLWTTLFSNLTKSELVFSKYILDKLPVTSTHRSIENFHGIFNELGLYDEINFIQKRELEELKNSNIFSRGLITYVTHKSKAKIGVCPWLSTLINWDGSVTPCPADFSSRYVVGNANKHSISEIWNNKKYRVFRRSIIYNDYSNLNNYKFCNHCSYANKIIHPLLTRSVNYVFKKSSNIKKLVRKREKILLKNNPHVKYKYRFLEKYFPLDNEKEWMKNLMRLKKEFDDTQRDVSNELE